MLLVVFRRIKMSKPKNEGLTLRQLQILHNLACGETTKGLAANTGQTQAATNWQLFEIRKKLRVETTVCAVVIALSMGLIPFPAWPIEKEIEEKREKNLALSEEEERLLLATKCREEAGEIYREAMIDFSYAYQCWKGWKEGGHDLDDGKK